MITEHDLQEAIAECQGVRHPDASTCIKLAAFYTIQQHMFGKEEPIPDYSYSSQKGPYIIDSNGESDFLQAVNGMDTNKFLEIINELMDTLRVINPRLYAGVMRKIAG